MAENKCPEPPKIYGSTLKWLKPLNQKSLYENLVNPQTATAFYQRPGNEEVINNLLSNHELFKEEYFIELRTEVEKLADKNKTYPNIDYERIKIKDPYSDGYQTLTKDGWEKHIFNILYTTRSDHSEYVYFTSQYNKWQELYRVFCSGIDPDNPLTALHDIGL